MDDVTLEILNTLIFRKEESVPRIIEQHNLTDRQFVYILEKVNNLITARTVPEVVIKNNHVVLYEETKEYFKLNIIKKLPSFDINLTKTNRQKYITLIIGGAHQEVSVNHLTDATHSSKSTIMSDIRDLRKEIKKEYNVELLYSRETGYYFSGSEVQIRNIIIKNIQKYLNQDNGEIYLNKILTETFELNIHREFKKIREIIPNEKLRLYGRKYEDFLYTFVMLMPRMQRLEIKDFKRFEIIDKASVEYEFVNLLGEEYRIIESNYFYLYAYLLSLNTGNITNKTKDQSVILKIVNDIVNQYDVLSGSYHLNRGQIIKKLYAHFRPTYYRILFGFPVDNPLLEDIKNNYSKVFYLVESVMKYVTTGLPFQISEDEIGYVTLYFASEIYEEPVSATKKINALIVCPSGVGTSTLLYKELTQLFPSFNFILSTEDSMIEKIEQDNWSIDIVFSTETSLSLLEMDIPFLVISPLMSENEKINLVSRVYHQISSVSLFNKEVNDFLLVVRKHVADEQYRLIEEELIKNHTNIQIEKGKEIMLTDIISKELVKLNVEADNWEEAIRKSTEVLVTENKVLPSYIDAIIDSVHENGPYIVITEHVALPHARPSEGAKELAISISTLETPVNFGNKENDPVKYIFGLSALDNSTHLNAMSELVVLLEDENFYHVLDHAKNSEEIIEYIENYKERDE